MRIQVPDASYQEESTLPPHNFQYDESQEELKMTQSEKGATYKSEYAQDKSRIKKINQSMKARSPRKSPTKKLVKAESQANDSPRRSTRNASPRKPPVPSAKGIAAYRKPSPTKKSPSKRPQTAVSPTKTSSPDKVESPTKRTTRAMRQ